MGTPLGSKYVPYTYMDPLGNWAIEQVEPESWKLSAPESCASKRVSNVIFRVLCLQTSSLHFRKLDDNKSIKTTNLKC